LGLPLIIIGGLAALAFFLTMTVGLSQRKILYAGLATVAAGVVAYFVTAPIMDDPSWLTLLLLAAVAAAVGAVIGWFFGGFEKKVAMVVCAGTAVAFGFLVFMDQLLRNWNAFLN